ncbi:MAG: ClbS/DfsB family four-helix bundle protein, partial [Chloroflexota bacterium]
PGMTWDDLDKLNEQTYLANKDRLLDEVLTASAESYSRVLDAIQNLSDEDLFDGSRFAWREGDPLWHMVAANTWWHYREHRQQVETWLKNCA